MSQLQLPTYVIGASLAFLIALPVSGNEAWRAKPIYGADDRIEVRDAPEALRVASQSVALLVPSRVLISTDASELHSDYQLSPLSIDDCTALCQDERFSDQLSLPACTAFLISQNLVATAAHCVKPDNDDGALGLRCRDLRIIFDYRLDDANPDYTAVNQDSVYRCSAVEDGVYYPPDGPDWRIIRLDRPAVSSHRRTLRVSTAKNVRPNTPVAVIGHPRGLPMKAAGNAVILRHGSLGGAVADLDTFVGNSGSPVFTDYGCGPVVIGLLSRGSEDFTLQPDSGLCLNSYWCNDGACLGEKITSSSTIADYADRPFSGC